jgi:hypothetical protein
MNILDDIPEVANIDHAFGKKCCGLLEEVLGVDMEQADFYDASGVAMFRVERIGPAMYTFRNLETGSVYGINRLGDPTYFAPVGVKGEAVDEEALKCSLEDDFEHLKFLEKREVTE